MSNFLQYAITGLSVGLLYSLIALGFVLIWKSSGVANLALGQLVLFFSWFAWQILSKEGFGLPAWLGFIIIILFSMIFGWLVERFVLRPLIAQPILSLITVTLGLGYLVEGIVGIIWPISLASAPRLFPETTVHIGSASISEGYLWAAGISLVIFALLSLYFKYNKMGIVMRATADNQLAVQACGIPVTKIFSRSWMFACALAAIGGLLLTNVTGNISPGIVNTGLIAFSVVILGGLESFTGAMIAGPIVGLTATIGSAYLTPYTWPGIREVIPFVIIIIVMFIKPYGLFGETRIERI